MIETRCQSLRSDQLIAHGPSSSKNWPGDRSAQLTEVNRDLLALQALTVFSKSVLACRYYSKNGHKFQFLLWLKSRGFLERKIMIYLSIYLTISIVVFLIFIYVDNSDSGNIEFDVLLPVQREIFLLILAILWPVILASVTAIRWEKRE